MRALGCSRAILLLAILNLVGHQLQQPEVKYNFIMM